MLDADFAKNKEGEHQQDKLLKMYQAIERQDLLQLSSPL
jgi:hypothetical protein